MYFAEYAVIFALMFLGLYGMAMKTNLIKKIVSLNILQTSTFLLFISTGYLADGVIPIVEAGTQGGGDTIYINPLPHVLILTAIVVGIATTALALTLILLLRRAYGTIQDDEIRRLTEEGEA